jgi:hypothetical protein
VSTVLGSFHAFPTGSWERGKNVEIVILENQNANVLIPFIPTSAKAECLFFISVKPRTRILQIMEI